MQKLLGRFIPKPVSNLIKEVNNRKIYNFVEINPDQIFSNYSKKLYQDDDNLISVMLSDSGIDDDQFINLLLIFLSNNNFDLGYVDGRVWFNEDTKSKLIIDFFLDLTKEPPFDNLDNISFSPRATLYLRHGTGKPLSLTLTADTLYTFLSRNKILELKYLSWIRIFFDNLSKKQDEYDLVLNFLAQEYELNKNSLINKLNFNQNVKDTIEIKQAN